MILGDNKKKEKTVAEERAGNASGAYLESLSSQGNCMFVLGSSEIVVMDRCFQHSFGDRVLQIGYS